MSNSRSSEKLTLFQDLKAVVERILSQYSYNVWSVYGGLQSLIQSLDAVLSHGIKPHTGLIGLVVDYWLFIRGLRWLDPTSATDIDNLSKLPAASPCKPPQLLSQCSGQRQGSQFTHGQQWIEQSLKNKNTSKQLEVLLADENHVKEHYYDWAFMMDSTYTSAALICISAVEQNSFALLGKLPASLFTRRLPVHSAGRLHQSNSISSTNAERGDTYEVEGTQQLKHTKPPDEASDSDPLNASNSKPIQSSPIKDRSHFKHSASFSAGFSDSSPLKVRSRNDTDTYSKSLTDELVPRANSVESMALHKPFSGTSQLVVKSEVSSSVARRPLFYDSSDDDCDPEDLGFLLDPTSETSVTVINNNVDSYYSTVELKPDLNAISAVSTPTKSTDDLTDTCIERKVLLPDLVISAQTSQSSNLDRASDERDNIVSMQKQPQEPQFSGASASTPSNFPRVRPSKHRRSRSDQLHMIKRLAVTQVDGPVRCGDDIGVFNSKPTKKSPSFSFVQSPSTYEHSIDSDSSLSRSTSLINYLKNQDLTTCADLDKENAHFDFSEILIGAIEQMKCQMQVHDVPTDESQPIDDVLHTLSESYQSPIGSFIAYEASNNSLPPLQSGLPDDDEGVSSPDHPEGSSFSDNTQRQEIGRTAESIAIGLLQAFSGHRHTAADEFDWLISEEDVPQKLLPIPESTVIDPDFQDDQGVRIRGNQDWAPPRPQIIFKAPVKLKRKVAMKKQNNRCAGCGTYVEKEFMRRFRYCEYTGKYFCTCCHDNMLSLLPASILWRFDFTKYKVSNFSYDVIKKMFNEPLFNIEDINPMLYKKAKVLANIRLLRLQMNSLNKYIQLCRFAESPTDEEEGGVKAITSLLPPHMLESDPHLYSLCDLERAKSGELLDQLKSAVEHASNHVTTCELCRSKGFLCEVCQADDVIFPHQSDTSTCIYCKSCFHKKCFVATECPKCARIHRRREALLAKEGD